MIFRIIIGAFFLSFSLSSVAQRHTQSGVIHTDIQVFTKDRIQINGTSKEMHIEYPPAEQKMIIRLDPHSIETDNIEFNEELEECLLGNFVFEAEVDGSRFEYQSRYNDTFEVESDATINNITRKVPILLIVNNKKTTDKNTLVIVGKGEMKLNDFELEEFFPQLEGVLKFQFTQNMVVNFR